MKKFVFIILVFLCFLTYIYAEESKFTQKLMVLPFGESELYTNIYVFNSIEEGDKVSKEIYGVTNFKELVESKNFKKLMFLMPEQGIIGYNYGIMKYGEEFWIFKNKDNVYLYGLGRYINPR